MHTWFCSNTCYEKARCYLIEFSFHVEVLKKGLIKNGGLYVPFITVETERHKDKFSPDEEWVSEKESGLIWIAIRQILRVLRKPGEIQPSGTLLLPYYTTIVAHTRKKL